MRFHHRKTHCSRSLNVKSTFVTETQRTKNHGKGTLSANLVKSVFVRAGTEPVRKLWCTMDPVPRGLVATDGCLTYAHSPWPGGAHLCPRERNRLNHALHGNTVRCPITGQPLQHRAGCLCPQSIWKYEILRSIVWAARPLICNEMPSSN